VILDASAASSRKSQLVGKLIREIQSRTPAGYGLYYSDNFSLLLLLTSRSCEGVGARPRPLGPSFAVLYVTICVLGMGIMRSGS
jgi:hypothetical protein